MKEFDINSIKSDVSKTKKDANKSSFENETEYLERQQLKALYDQDVATRRLFNDMLKQDNEQRIKYAEYIFTFTCVWCLCVFVFLTLSGFQKNFIMSDNVIITLITTTTINAFVFFRLVTKYLFRHNGAEFYAPITRNDNRTK